MKSPTSLLSLADIASAQALIRSGIRRTPCHLAPRLSAHVGRRIWLKREDLQRTGSFKERGARHALLRLRPEDRAAGIVTASAGNHALGLAYHGSQLGVRVTVVMPTTAPEIKVRRCSALGAAVVLRGVSYDEASAHARALASESGAAFIHPFDDWTVMAGQGTLALEIHEQAGEFETLVVPVGGGGLLAGVATVTRALRPQVELVAAEPAHAACFAAAWREGRPTTIRVRKTLADGLAVGRSGERAFAAAQAHVDRVVEVSEEAIAEATSLLARLAGVTAEGAAAVPLAALLSNDVGSGGAVMLPITGRNIDAGTHAAVLARSADFPSTLTSQA